MADLQAETVPQLPAEFTKAIEGIKAKLQAGNAAPELSSPQVGIICGSGLSGLGDVLKSKVLVPYEEVEGFGRSTGQSHLFACPLFLSRLIGAAFTWKGREDGVFDDQRSFFPCRLPRPLRVRQSLRFWVIDRRVGPRHRRALAGFPPNVISVLC